MDLIWLILAIICYILALISLIYPLLPGAILFGLAVLFIGLSEGFTQLGTTFWIIQGIVFVLLHLIDFFVSKFGIERSGGSKAAVWGSVIGLIIGPIVIPVAGLLVGPLIGAIIGDLWSGQRDWKVLSKVGISSLVAFIVGSLFKGLFLIINGIYIFFYLL